MTGVMSATQSVSRGMWPRLADDVQPKPDERGRVNWRRRNNIQGEGPAWAKAEVRNKAVMCWGNHRGGPGAGEGRVKGHGVDVGELRSEQGSVMEAPGALGRSWILCQGQWSVR